MTGFKQTCCPEGDAATSPDCHHDRFARPAPLPAGFACLRSLPGPGLALVLMLQAGIALADFEDGWDAYQSGEFGIAYSEWLPLAEEGHSGAQLNIGVMYRKGEGVPQDPEKAFHWFSRAAEAGDSAAQYNIAILYRDGLGTGKDEAAALEWFRKSAEQGNSFGQLQLGLDQLYGRTAEQDLKSGILLINRAAEAGNPHAAYELAKIYQHGCALTEENAEAVKWFERAALARHSAAAFAAGLMYSEGCGIPADPERGHAWLTVAHRRGQAEAEARAEQLGETLDDSRLEAAGELARSFLSGTGASVTDAVNGTEEASEGQPEVQMVPPGQYGDKDEQAGNDDAS